MTTRASQEYRYEKLTWPEINDAVELGKVCIVPCGAVEQHGPASAAGCRSGLSRRASPRGGAADSRQDAGAADRRLRLHRARDGFSRHDQQRLRALHAPCARYHQVAGLPRLQENHPAQRPRLEHAEPRPGRPPHEPGNRRRVRARRLVEPADRRQGVPAALAAEQVPWRLRSCLEEKSPFCGSTSSPPGRQPSSPGPAATARPACWGKRNSPPRKKGGRLTKRRSSSSSAL